LGSLAVPPLQRLSISRKKKTKGAKKREEIENLGPGERREKKTTLLRRERIGGEGPEGSLDDTRAKVLTENRERWEIIIPNLRKVGLKPHDLKQFKRRLLTTGTTHWTKKRKKGQDSRGRKPENP